MYCKVLHYSIIYMVVIINTSKRLCMDLLISVALVKRSIGRRGRIGCIIIVPLQLFRHIHISMM